MAVIGQLVNHSVAELQRVLGDERWTASPAQRAVVIVAGRVDSSTNAHVTSEKRVTTEKSTKRPYDAVFA